MFQTCVNKILRCIFPEVMMPATLQSRLSNSSKTNPLDPLIKTNHHLIRLMKFWIIWENSSSWFVHQNIECWSLGSGCIIDGVALQLGSKKFSMVWWNIQSPVLNHQITTSFSQWHHWFAIHVVKLSFLLDDLPINWIDHHLKFPINKHSWTEVFHSY